MREGDVSQCLYCDCDVGWYYDNIKSFCGNYCETRWRKNIEQKEKEEEEKRNKVSKRQENT